MKISLQTIPIKENSGEATQITTISLAKELKELGHEVKINDDPKNADIIHSISAAPIKYLKFLYFKKSNKNARFIHSLKSYSKNKFFRNTGLKILNFADKIIVPTKIYKNKIISKGVKKDKIEIIHSHIDTNKFKPEDKIEMKEKLGFSDKKIILYYGAMWEGKGPQYLLKSVPYIIEKYPDLFFIFICRHTLKELIKAEPNQVKKLKWLINRNKDNIILIEKKLKNIEEYVAMADIVVLPYKNIIATEMNPSCILESMSAGTPVITSSIPEIKELFEENEGVLYITPGDVDELINKVDFLFSNYEAYQKIRKLGIERAKEFDLSNIVNRYLDIYDSVSF